MHVLSHDEDIVIPRDIRGGVGKTIFIIGLLNNIAKARGDLSIFGRLGNKSVKIMTTWK